MSLKTRLARAINQIPVVHDADQELCYAQDVSVAPTTQGPSMS